MKKIVIVHIPLSFTQDWFDVECIDTDKPYGQQVMWSAGGGIEHILKCIQSNKETLYEEEKK